MMPSDVPGYSPGLEDVIAGLSGISKVDPEGDELIYYGYKVSQLCEQSSFEEVCYLLLNGTLPLKNEFTAFQKKLIEERSVPSKLIQYICELPKEAHYMDVLRSGISNLSHYDPQCEDNSKEAELAKSIRLIAKVPTLLAARIRAQKGAKPLAPHAKLGHAANFLWMLKGEKPSASACSQKRVATCLAAHSVPKFSGHSHGSSKAASSSEEMPAMHQASGAPSRRRSCRR